MREIQVGVIYKNSENWTGGDHFYRNLFAATKNSIVEIDIRFNLLKKRSKVPSILLPFIDKVLELPAPPPPPKFWNRQRIRSLKQLGVWREPASHFENYLRSNHIDVVLTEVDLDSNFGIPTLSWIPDFQHIHFPNYFSEEDLSNRNHMIRNLVKNSTMVILSSQDAKRDFEEFTPDQSSKAQVLSFVSQLPKEVYQEDPVKICNQYHLPDRFIYLPNQFWLHKNHELVLNALELVYDNHPEIHIVCTGNTNEYRNRSYFSQLMTKIALKGIRERMIILGLLPYRDIFQLMRQSLAVLQPSLFEGWSTIVEEVKSLGKTILLSDIPVHREQNPERPVYFDPQDPVALASCLVETYQTCLPGPDLDLEFKARESLPGRTQKFAMQFACILEKVIG
jgi:glycosyltransferase involved in cell wall biosynthesis